MKRVTLTVRYFLDDVPDGMVLQDMHSVVCEYVSDMNKKGWVHHPGESRFHPRFSILSFDMTDEKTRMPKGPYILNARDIELLYDRR